MTWALRMSLRDLAAEAVASLKGHRLRTALSAIGIVFGIATVVTALAIGEGARRSALAEIGVLGLDNVFVRSSAGTAAAAPALSLGEARVIAASVDGVVAAAGSRTVQTEMTAASRHAPAALVGVSPAWRVVFDLDLADGRWLVDGDDRAGRRVAVIGAELARALFGAADPIGERVSAGGAWYAIVGRLRDRSAAAGRSAIPRVDTGRALIVPLSAMDVSLGAGDTVDRVQEIAIRLTGAAAVERAAGLLPRLLARRRLDAGRYELIVPRELLRARLRAQRTFDTVLLAIGALALAISGIGIMNIMLASVAERTQEIGVRRAFGARRAEILAQFALESAVLCTAGGLAGVPLGAALSGIVALAAGWPVSVSIPSVVLAVALACVVGVAFGVYPARVAASIQPIDALRAG